VDREQILEDMKNRLGADPYSHWTGREILRWIEELEEEYE